VTLNINTTPSTPQETPALNRRRRLADELLNELMSWNPREFIAAFRRWHHGSFSLIHLNVLTILDADGPDSMSHLAEALDVSVASMTGIVDRMEKRGLVERRHEGNDRRVVLLHPTEAGIDVFRDIDRRRREGLVRILERLTDDELAGLLSGHRALRNARAVIAAATHAAETSGAADSDSASPAAPPGLHPRSTIPPDDADVEPDAGPDA
jgi:DNA-binding MarR family transcriptional regulator